MHDFQRDVSHLERLAELWLRSHASTVPTSAWEWTSDRRGISQGPLYVDIFESHALATPSRNSKNVVAGTRASWIESGAIYVLGCDDLR